MSTSRRGLTFLFAASIAALLLAGSIAVSSGCMNSVKERIALKKGNELYVAKKYELAIKEYEKLLALNPKSWEGNYLTAVSYLALYHPGSEHPKDKEYAEKGLAAFERTLALTAPSPEEREKTEKFYLSFLDSTGDKDKAIAYLEKQLATRPNDIALINQIATIYQKKGDFVKSLEYFEKRANMDPKNKETWYTLGVNCWARSYHGGPAVSQEEREAVVEKGIKAFERALEIDPNYFDALSYINLIYIEKAKALAAVGKNEEAGQAYAKSDEYRKRAIDVKKAQVAKEKAA
ncbi:MAG TPA: tetratricopeptide repeat-containing protein [Candidatus Polarisedimenticolaceae bacterium]|nr:tetratricopeptide repeat-containing protein [Candidatus Polarisedimenticolaceae bacterium]